MSIMQPCNTYNKQSIMAFLAVVLVCFFACNKNDKPRADAVVDRSAMPVLMADTVNTLISDSGITRYRIKTPRFPKAFISRNSIKILRQKPFLRQIMLTTTKMNNFGNLMVTCTHSISKASISILNKCFGIRRQNVCIPTRQLLSLVPPASSTA